MTTCIQRRAGIAVAAALMLGGCGAAGHQSTTATAARSAPPAVQVAPTPVTRTTTTSIPVLDELRAAEHPTLGEFPGVDGRTLAQVAALATSGAQLTAATGFYTPGRSAMRSA
jgi:hypothetical protein